MRLYNTLTRQIDNVEPIQTGRVRIYSCGPTVYDHIHIGNLSAYIYADLLRRALHASGYDVTQVMNFTDVDDKTIRRSTERYPDMAPEEALEKLTDQYKQIFLDDAAAVGVDLQAIQFVSAVASIDGMRKLVTDLYKKGFAYIADDGVYFSIEKYRASGKTYGQLLKLDAHNTSEARINNDEYDKESVHDFALWKTQKSGEPAWEFELDGHDLLGRPGWHIECSVMSVDNLGQPFDIHTGGVDNIFPHHENEIAQSTAGQDDPIYAKHFVHNDHLLVDGKKMAKSAQNFFTLRDIRERGFDPRAFRLLVLQSHYRSQTNFTWESLAAAQTRLRELQAFADLRWQPLGNTTEPMNADFKVYETMMLQALQDDLATPKLLATLSTLLGQTDQTIIRMHTDAFTDLLEFLDNVLGLQLLASTDITDEQQQLIAQRQTARDSQDWTASDRLRDQLQTQGIAIHDTPHGQTWSRI